MLRSLYSTLEPKIITLLRREKYLPQTFLADMIAGLAVAIVALPLAMAIAIASPGPVFWR